MKKVLIATTNTDKFNAVSKVFKNTIFPEKKYIIEGLMNISIEIKEEKEKGDNVERARTKAITAKDSLKDTEYQYDYIVGLDDAIRIKGKLEPNIKEYLNKILFENYLLDGEEYAFNRAYCIIDKDNKIYETDADIPYIYHPLKDNFELKEHTYPLSKVAYPKDKNYPICELTEEEETDYYLKYVKEKLLALKIK